MSVSIKGDFGNKGQRKADLSTLVYGKVPPQALELEEAVLGACLLEKDTFDTVMQVIPNHECFYADSHQRIYEAMCLVRNAGDHVDLYTVAEQLRKMECLELVGGLFALDRLSMKVLTSAHVEAHARIVMEKFMQREVIRICGTALNDAYEDSTDVFDLMETVETEIKSITDGIIGGSDVAVGITYGKMIEKMEQQRKLNSDVIGVRSGYDELDRMTLGWQKTDSIILAARPSQGKTAVAVNFALNAKHPQIGKDGTTTMQPTPTLIFSLESTDIPLVRRMAAAKLSIPLKDIRRGCPGNEFQMELIKKEASSFYQFPIKIDSKSRSLSSIKKVIRKWAKAQRKFKPNTELLVIIDYLQLMSVDGKGNREQEISKISRDIKELATEMELPIISLSQLNRETEKTGSKKPMLSNLRESGALEQDANIVMMIWWEQTSEKDSYNNPVMKTWIVVAKNRDGECGDVQLKFNGDIQRWMNMEESVSAVPASSVLAGFQNSRNPAEGQVNWEE